MTVHPILEDMDEDDFLSGGADGSRPLDIDNIFAKDWQRVVAEMRQADPAALDLPEDCVATPSLIVDGYRFVDLAGGVALVDPDGTIVGGYLSCDLSLDESHQGQGLGAELVVETFLRNGDLPTWHLDTPAYSPAGEAAHRAAYRMLCEQPDLIDKKISLIDSGGVPLLVAPVFATLAAHKQRP